METEKYFCQNCGRELRPDQKVCPSCNCSKRLIKKELEGKLLLQSSLESKQKRKGFKKPLREIFSGWQKSGDKKKHPEGVKKERVIDRKKRYI